MSVQPTSNAAKAAGAGIGAAIVLALSLLFRHHSAPPRPAPVPPVSATVPSVPATETMDQAAKDRAARVAEIIASTPVFPPAPDGRPRYVPPVYGPDLCDHTAAIDVPPNIAAGECLAGTAVWNPAAHNVNWFTAPDTIYEDVRALPSAIVAGKLPVTLTKFPCGVTAIAFYWAGCRLVRVCPPECPGRCGADGLCPPPGLPQMPLHASAASVVDLPAGHCGITVRDPLTGQGTPLYRCTLAEMGEESKAWMAAQAKEQSEERLHPEVPK